MLVWVSLCLVAVSARTCSYVLILGSFSFPLPFFAWFHGGQLPPGPTPSSFPWMASVPQNQTEQNYEQVYEGNEPAGIAVSLSNLVSSKHSLISSVPDPNRCSLPAVCSRRSACWACLLYLVYVLIHQSWTSRSSHSPAHLPHSCQRGVDPLPTNRSSFAPT